MATVKTKTPRRIEYPTSDGKPMAETDLHRNLMIDVIQELEAWYADAPMTYVTGNLLLFYEEGNKRKHIAPDVFVVHGIPKRKRLYYLMWEEGKGPDAAIELTSKTTRKEDTDKKHVLYRDVLKVSEYFLFDPTGDYLNPRLQGFRLENGDYRRIEPVNGRLPSEVLGLHLEQDGDQLRLWDPKTGKWLPTKEEALWQKDRERDQITQERDREIVERRKLEEELAQLRAQLDKQQGNQPPQA
ncbi:MAG TPA: Uma2 family endonuclease [Gemmataceae bacterium]|nr:Uma2 family endonuclease [Gemmataceae bacterium]